MEKEKSMPNFVELEHKVIDFWKKENTFQKLVDKNKDKPTYKALDGPITANNAMGIHHMWGRTLKDAYIKFAAMTGKAPKFQNGFDAHGLPVEVEVEKELGLKNKKEIMAYGEANFVEKCLERVNRFGNLITDQSIRIGQWMDWDNSYYTNTDENITSIWHFLKIVSDNGWLVKNSRPIQWCPRCGTSLSSHEVHGSYKDVEHEAVFFTAPVKGENYSMLVWTTTPWTLSSNVAIAVNPNNTYLEVKTKSGKNLIVGKEALKVLKGDIETVVREFLGKEIVGKTYETCFPMLEVQNFEHKIVEWDEVSATDGSGAVHIAPGCGVEDYELGKKLGLKEITPIDENGVIIEGFGFLSGYTTDEVRQIVFDSLKEQGKLYYTHKFLHSYPICWRCKTELVFRLVDSWFIKVDEIKPKLVEAVKTVKWEPEFLEKRMLDWLENMGDWNISRSRYYGLPLPIYITEKGEIIVVGSLEELRELAVDKSVVDNLPHLHRPYIDAVKIKSPKTGDIATRVAEVGDTWLDAGITPFSTNKYFTDREFFEKHFPAEVVIEMREQIRLWFYSLLLMSVVITGKAPYSKVIGHESVVQEDGSKFSKSGFSIKAQDFSEKLGADTARYMFAGNSYASDIRFSYNLGEEARRKMLGFWNCYTFFNTYAVIDNPKLDTFKPTSEMLTVTDKWLLQVTDEFVKNSYKNYTDHKTFIIVKDFENLVDDISNFYIRSNRRRFWKNDEEQDKLTAYYCLYKAIKAITQVMAPIIPFMTEHIWQKLVRQIEKDAEISVFLSDFPTSVIKEDYKDIVENAKYAQNIISLSQRLRNENQLKVKQPLSKLFVVAEDEVARRAVSMFENIICDELNVKEVINETNGAKFNNYYLTVNFKTAGAILKNRVQELKQLLENMPQEQMNALVEQFDSGVVNVDGFDTLNSNIFNKNSRPKQEFVLANENGLTVVLDTTLTQELINEGYLRELIRHAQVLRKEANFDIDARVLMKVETQDENILNVVNQNIEKIKDEVLAQSLNEVEFTPDIKETVLVGDSDVIVSLKTL